MQRRKSIQPNFGSNERSYILVARSTLKTTFAHNANNLKNEFDYSPLGKELFKMYQKDRRFFYVFYGLGFVSYSGALINLFDRKFKESNILLTGAMVCWSGAFTFSITADKKLKKAVWYRNRDMLLREYR
jgi:hypothetical protein